MSGDPPESDERRAQAHAPRPTDLVALVTFDGEVYENQAVTRERLARPTSAPHPLNAAIEQWLGRGRHTWIDVRGRQINGIATARPLAGPEAWVIDTLVDASAAPDGGVPGALLRQALEAAARQQVRHVLLRAPVDAPVLPEALRVGFQQAMSERLWRGDGLRRLSHGEPGVTVREAGEEDAFALFQLYNRALPMDGRQALALTQEEWQRIQERRWLHRGGREYVAVEGDRVCAHLRLTPEPGSAQFDLLADAQGERGARALLDRAADDLADCGGVLALVPVCAAPLERLLAERGLEAGVEYALLSRRMAKPVAEIARASAGMAVTRGV